ncbi:hypothetical protein CSC70_03075 [Pseudoxanthomonas kalamensis DSM 18571]|uniref:DUF2059 domain-containing protein n=1 Tax=Pseudoxanthomonas kalamensis TaxID=289483 RepID=UPI0013908088|nr:DUF2059 domain-containing protein [Pseudoxanthomonas kalamensis]KAF1712510.1 hypothetical protein CSC70_03075 [Pseudoxanthomonas kalamensis DSM 18571]
MIRKSWVAVLLLLFPFAIVATAVAAESLPSEASVRDLLQVTEARKMIDASIAQIEPMMQATTQQALQGHELDDAQQALVAEMNAKLVGLLGETLDWDSLEPSFIDIYRKSFSQDEIDGMLQFYRSDAGKAVIAKMPQVMQYSMELSQQRVLGMMPKLQALQAEYLEKLKATD